MVSKWQRMKWKVDEMTPNFVHTATYSLHKAIMHRGRSKEIKNERLWGVSVNTKPSRKMTEKEVDVILDAVCDCERLKCCLSCRVPTGGAESTLGSKTEDTGKVNFYFSYPMEQYSMEEAVEYAKLDTARSYRMASEGLLYTIVRMSINDADEWGGEKYVIGSPDPEWVEIEENKEVEKKTGSASKLGFAKSLIKRKKDAKRSKWITATRRPE